MNYGELLHVSLMSRRKFLKLGMIAAAFGFLPIDTIEAAGDFLSDERSIHIYNLHTKEMLDTVYWRNDKYSVRAFEGINHIFRDHYNGQTKPVDPRLIDFLYAVQKKLHSKEPVHLISGYRSKMTNKLLRKQNKRVARNSLHIYGKAADIRIPDMPLREVRRAAYHLRSGGVGYYPRSKFVHMDVGRIRFWRG